VNLRTLGWAAYVAVSWTWCIGMFFPVLLVRDYGIWGFVAFAVPNVVGAGAMGWVLCRDGMSERLVHRHRHAMVAFSVVTAAFHLYWLVWLIYVVLDAPVLIMFIIMLLIMLGQFPSGDSKRSSRHYHLRAAAGVLVFSGWMAIEMWNSGDMGLPKAPPVMATGGLWYLSLPLLLGFALCPYLDLTFHHARQSLGVRSAKTAFTIGFGVLFLAMILITLGYSGLVERLLSGSEIVAPARLGSLVIHIGIQVVVTLAFHAALVGTNRGSPRRSPLAWGLLVGMVVGVLPIVVGADPVHAGLSIGELIYRGFMVFYGLVFPAYVWIAMIPTRDGHSGIKGRDGRHKRRVLAGVIALALPFYWLGFIERIEPWIVVGVAVVLLGRLAVRGGGGGGGAKVLPAGSGGGS